MAPKSEVSTIAHGYSISCSALHRYTGKVLMSGSQYKGYSITTSDAEAQLELLNML